MPDEEERAFRCQRLAMRFELAARKDDSRAAEFRELAEQKRREAAEHPEASDLRTQAEGLMGVVIYWEKQSAWAREMAGDFWRRADEHRARHRSDL